METTFYITKLIMALTGIWFVYSSSTKDAKPWHFLSGCTLLGFVFFMAGVEFMSPVEDAWSYWLFEANKDDCIKALLGGSMMLLLPFILMAVCGKDIIEIIELTDNASSKDVK